MSYDLYTDGSYCQYDGSSGYGVFSTELELCACGEGKKVRNSSQAEYYAVRMALERVLKFDGYISKANIYTDFWAIIEDTRVMDIYCHPRLNAIYEKTQSCRRQGIKVRFFKVTAHQGIAGNEIADKLATLGRNRATQTNRANFNECIKYLAECWDLNVKYRGIPYETPPQSPVLLPKTVASPPGAALVTEALLTPPTPSEECIPTAPVPSEVITEAATPPTSPAPFEVETEACTPTAQVPSEVITETDLLTKPSDQPDMLPSAQTLGPEPPVYRAQLAITGPPQPLLIGYVPAEASDSKDPSASIQIKVLAPTVSPTLLPSCLAPKSSNSPGPFSHYRMRGPQYPGNATSEGDGMQQVAATSQTGADGCLGMGIWIYSGMVREISAVFRTLPYGLLPDQNPPPP